MKREIPVSPLAGDRPNEKESPEKNQLLRAAMELDERDVFLTGGQAALALRMVQELSRVESGSVEVFFDGENLADELPVIRRMLTGSGDFKNVPAQEGERGDQVYSVAMQGGMRYVEIHHTPDCILPDSDPEQRLENTVDHYSGDIVANVYKNIPGTIGAPEPLPLEE